MTLAALGLALALAAPADADGPTAWFPPDGFLGAWQRAEPTRIYTGAELYEHIDGAAEAFFELGFVKLSVQEYHAREDAIGVELYELTDPVAALGIYLGKCGDETPAPGLDDRHTAGRHQLLLVRDSFFLVVDNLSGRPERAAALVAFAQAIASRLPPARPIDVLDALPAHGRVPGSERLFRGPLGLQAWILLGEGDVLRLEGRITALAARYDGGDRGPYTLVLVPYPDESASRSAFDHVAQRLDPELRPLSREAARLVFQDHSGRFGIVARRGATVEITFGLERAPGARAEPADATAGPPAGTEATDRCPRRP